MKKVFYIAVCLLAAVLVSSCKKLTTEGVTGITYYATITLEGSPEIVHQKGTPFTDPGYSAVLNGEDVTSEVVVINPVDVTKSGAYTIVYTCTNEDGFASSTTRSVIVLDLKDPVEGFYTTSPDSYRLNAAGTKTVYGSPFTIAVFNNGDGTYQVDDMLGGYYAQRAGYGSNYAMDACIKIAADGTLELISSIVPGWGDEADGLEGKYIAGESKFDFCTGYAGMSFFVVMTKD